jgi:hypothetical protein
MSVSIQPGAIALTWILYGASSQHAFVPGFVATEDRDGRTGLGEPQGYRPPDAAVAARHDGDAAR